jgi:hypothetical protein
MTDYLPEHWRQWLEKHGRLSVRDFGNQKVSLRFVDGSLAVFEFAFFVVNEEREELAVFTEHCGHHVFSLPTLDEYACPER